MAEDPNPEFIRFSEVPSELSRTKIWYVCSVNAPDKDSLGLIKWFGRWRKYCFFIDTPGLVFDHKCLRKIADFCETETNKFWEEKRK